jgi:hypothetical protein
LVQLRPSWSSQREFDLLNLTIRPVSGASAPVWSVLGPGRPPGGTPARLMQGKFTKPSQTTPSFSVVVWLPDWNTAA